MTNIPGSSQFLGAATLARQNGTPAQSVNLLGSISDFISLASIARQNSVPGIGLSANARSLNESQLASSNASFNALFSLTAGVDGTIEGAQAQILALRASLPSNQIASFLRGDDGGVSESATGNVVDEEA